MRPLLLALLSLALALPCLAQEPSAAEWQKRAESAKGGERVRLELHAAHAWLEEADRSFTVGNVGAAHGALNATVLCASLGIETSLTEHKAQKNAEIELRKLIRRAREVAQSVDSEDRPHLERATAELERQRNRLLEVLFGDAAKERSGR